MGKLVVFSCIFLSISNLYHKMSLLNFQMSDLKRNESPYEKKVFTPFAGALSYCGILAEN